MGAERRRMERERETPRENPESGPRELRRFLADSPEGKLDRLIYERVRLGIMSALAVNETLSFSALKELLDTSDGNLSAHARKLENAGYVKCSKTFRDRIPHTEFQLTSKGRAALERYLDHMEALIRATRE